MEQSIIARAGELASLAQFIDSISSGPVALLLEGEAGIGKSLLWRRGVALARDRGFWVLSSRPAEAETTLSYAGLGDLLGGVLDRALPQLASPQRRALESALLLAGSEGRADQRAVSVAVLSTVRWLAEDHPVVLAVDDLHWLDRPSARVLEFVLRRLEHEPVGLLAGVRTEDPAAAPLGLDRALPEGRLLRVRIPPLSLGALQLVLRAHLGETFPRPILGRLRRVSGGNPLFALEIARALIRSGRPVEPGDALPVPDSLRDLLAGRIDALHSTDRDALLIASALSRPTIERVDAVLPPSRRGRPLLAKAEEARVVEVRSGRINFTHPLLASVVYTSASAPKRRDVHRRLAETASDPEERARHLALSSAGPDEEVATELEGAARGARARGAPDGAAEMCELALRLTPSNRPAALRRRAMRAAEYHLASGDTDRARALLEQAVKTSPPGPRRGEALLRLALVLYHELSLGRAATLLGEALQEVGEDQRLQAWVHLVAGRVAVWSGDVPRGLGHARAALELAEELGDEALLPLGLTAVAMTECFAGNGLPRDIARRALALGDPEEALLPLLGEWRSGVTLASLLIFSDDLDEARAQLEVMRRQALERGDEGSLPGILFWLSELESRAARFTLAVHHAREGQEIAVRASQQLMQAQLLYSRALAEANLGSVEPARAAAEQGLRLAERLEAVFPTIRNLSVLGYIDLCLGNLRTAHAHLASASDLAARAGFRDPGQFQVAANLFEAALGLGQLREAESLLDLLEERGRTLGREWARAVGARCRGLVLAASGNLSGAVEVLEAAVTACERLGMPLELARTWLAVGSVQRRMKRKRAARDSLQRALEAFEGVGAALWAERAREELGRIGGRAPSPTELTPSERGVAERVGEGLTNREVADALFMSVHTVEANLKRIYRKLRVRSRTEMARALERGRSAQSRR